MAAHVGLLTQLARTHTFESLLYLSSTRVYDGHLASPAHEEDELRLRPQDPEHLYPLSKAAGEATALAAGGRVARLSNVYGPALEEHAFLSAVLRQATGGGRVTLDSALDSARDFVSVADVVSVLTGIALEGRERVYNVAAGVNVTNREVTQALAAVSRCEVVVRPGAPRIVRPTIDVSRVREEFGFSPAAMLDDVGALLEDGRVGTARP
jgi:nucleoside-diphosphate-sugar epimerase